MVQTAQKPRRSTSRINRSISFPLALHDYVARKAVKEQRSFNWIVNDLVQRELSRAR